MRRVTAVACLLLSFGCADSTPSGGVSYDYVYNPTDQQFRRNTLHQGELASWEVITAEEYDRDSGSGLTSEQIRAASQGGACGLTPGDYVIEYSIVADPCQLGPLQTELITVGTETFQGTRMMPAANGCVDEWSAEGCTTSLTRQCEMFFRDDVVSLELSVTIDAASRTGTAMIHGIPDDSMWGAFDTTCTSAQSLTIEALD